MFAIQYEHKKEDTYESENREKEKEPEVLRCINVNLNSIITNQNILCLQLQQIIALLRKIIK